MTSKMAQTFFQAFHDVCGQEEKRLQESQKMYFWNTLIPRLDLE